MTAKQWSAWLLAAGITTLLTVISVDLESGGTDTGSPSISLVHMTRAQKDSVIHDELQKANIGQEIVSMRRSDARFIKQGNGKINAHVYSRPKFYIDPNDSVFKEIDLTVYDIADTAKSNPLRKFDKYVDAGVYRASWFNGKPHDYTFYKDGYFIKYTALFDTINVPTNTVPQTDGIKQTYTFKDAKSVQDLKWLMSSNTVKQRRDDGSITFSDSTGTLLFVLPAPTAWDANYLPILVTSVLNGDTLVYSPQISIDVVYPITVDPTTTVTSLEPGRSVRQDNTVSGTYYTARDNTEGYLGAQYQTGQYCVTYYYIPRSFLYFDLSGIGNVSSVDACSLYVYGTTDGSATDFNMFAVAAKQSGPFAVGWYNDFYGWVSGGAHSPTYYTNTWNTSSYVAGWFYLTFTSTGIDSVKAHCAFDTLRVALLSSRDISRTAPTGYEYITIDRNSYGYPPYLSIAYSVPPNAPSNFANTGATTTTLSYSWTDNSSDELGFKIKNAGGDTVTVGTYAAGATTGTVGSLGINTRHGLRVFAYSASGWSTPSDSVVKYTLANPASVWAFTGAGATTITPGFNANSNPSTTQYAIRDSTRHVWIESDGTTSAIRVWRTEAQWEAITISGLTPNTEYRHGVVAKNGDEVETAYIWGTVYTLAAVPGLSALTAISPFSIHFIIDPKDNPSSMQYAVQDSITGLYADGSAEPETLRTGSLGDWGWKTFTQWGGVQGDTLTGLFPDSLYVIRVKARTGE